MLDDHAGGRPARKRGNGLNRKSELLLWTFRPVKRSGDSFNAVESLLVDVVEVHEAEGVFDGSAAAAAGQIEPEQRWARS